MEQLSTSRASKGRRLMLLAGALLLAVLSVMPASNAALAQDPPPPEDDVLTLVNASEDFVERRRGGRFIARPVFDREVDRLYYAVRHPDTGEWLTAMYRVLGGDRRLSHGWEYTFEYPVLDEQPDLDGDRAYLLVLVAPRVLGGEPHTFHAVVLVHQPDGLWDRVIGALNPARWARAAVAGSSRGCTGRSAGGGACGGRHRRELPGELRHRMNDLLTGTPPERTYLHPLVRPSPSPSRLRSSHETPVANLAISLLRLGHGSARPSWPTLARL